MLELRQYAYGSEALHKDAEDNLDSILVHRLAVGARVTDAVRAFSMLPELAKIFSGKFPYHFFVEGDGTVHQVLPLSKEGVHALSWNARSVGVAVAGDFNIYAAPWVQWRATKMLCGLLSYPQGWAVLGHTEAHRKGPPATKDDGKLCPGKKWDMGLFREEMWQLDIRDADVNTFWRRVRC